VSVRLRAGTWLQAGSVADLDRADVLGVPLPRDHERVPREALVLRDPSGTVRAYLNRCRHLPIPLDGGSRRYLDDGKRYLMCGTHGALFRREDGYCFEGPCRGDSLFALEVEIDPDGTIWISEHAG